MNRIFKIICTTILYLSSAILFILLASTVLDYMVFIRRDSLIIFISELAFFISILILNLVFLKKFKVKSSFNNIKMKDMLMSFFIGLIWISIPAIYLLFNNMGKILEINKFNGFNFFIFTLALFINSAFQELLIRGFLYEYLKEKTGVFISIVITTVIFLLLHGIPTSIVSGLNLVLMSLLMVVILEKTENIFNIVLVHFIWNFMWGLLFGLIDLGGNYPVILQIKNMNRINLENLVITIISSLIAIVTSQILFRNKKEQI